MSSPSAVPRPTTRVVGLVGSLRAGSYNRALLRAAATVAPADVEVLVDGDLGLLPFFNEDTEGARTPAPVHDLRRQVADGDAVLVATPEYNGGMPGVLKNALDWLSRPTGESVLAGRPVAVVGTSPGRRGAVRAQAEVRRVLTAIGAEVLDDELPVPSARHVFTPEGGLVDDDLLERLRGHVRALVSSARGPEGSPEVDESAVYSLECQRAARAAG